MVNRNVELIPGARALVTLGVFSFCMGVMELSARSILRMWVDSQRNEWVVPYQGHLLNTAGLVFMGFGVIVLAFAFLPNSSARFERTLLNGCILLLGAACVGLIATGITQAGFHVARLAILDSYVHPRSVVTASISAAALGLLLLVLSWWEGRKSTGRY